jgi:hypothetical protein
MKKKIEAKEKVSLKGFIILASVSGFPLVAGLSTVLGVSSTPLSIVMRAAILLCSLILLLNFLILQKRVALLNSFGFIIFFWLCYLLRVGFISIYEPETLNRSLWVYWVFGLGASYVPMLAVAFSRKTCSSSKTYNGLVFVTVVAVFLAIACGDTLVGSGRFMYDSGRLRLDSLNPISLGHLAVTLALLSYWRFRNTVCSKYLSGYLILLFVTGVVGVVLAASRGPLIALLLCISVIEVNLGLASKFKIIFITIFIMICILLMNDGFFDHLMALPIIERMSGAVELKEAAAVGRATAYRAALLQFTKNPIIGSMIEDPVTHYYPHNMFLEGFMATGIIGGVFLVIGIIGILCHAVKLIKNDKQWGWIGVLFFQYFIGAQVSGAIYSTNSLWVLTGAVFALSQIPRSLSLAKKNSRSSLR